MTLKNLKYLPVLALSLAFSLSFADSEIIDADSITKSLMPVEKDLLIEGTTNESQSGETTTRGFVPLSEDETSRISLQAINFEFDSDILTSQAKQQLEQLAIALSSKNLEQYSFELIGHTDAKGSEEYNLSLSDRRAASVLKYLVHEYGVSADRINAYGQGERYLTDSSNPYSSINRRVEIITQ